MPGSLKSYPRRLAPRSGLVGRRPSGDRRDMSMIQPPGDRHGLTLEVGHAA
ncbi:hypothetical protein ACSSVY_001970 [Roseovarius sp. MBR-51]